MAVIPDLGVEGRPRAHTGITVSSYHGWSYEAIGRMRVSKWEGREGSGIGWFCISAFE